MSEQENSPETEIEPKDIANRLELLIAWFAVAAVVILVIGWAFTPSARWASFRRAHPREGR